MAEEGCRKVRRGFSVSQGNESLISEARTKIFDKIEEKTDNQAPYFKDSSNSTFLLPNLSIHQFKFRAHLENDLIERSTMIHLENSGRLNWWCDNDCMQRLWPLSTTGDGNCLLHAASLAMWGFHDRHLNLRHALHHRLILDNIGVYRRWVLQSLRDQQHQGFELSREELEQEWHEVCSLSLPTPRGVSVAPHVLGEQEVGNNNDKYLICCHADDGAAAAGDGAAVTAHNKPHMEKFNSLGSNKSGGSSQRSALKQPVSLSSQNSFYDFLEQIHVFVLAQVVRRPILIVADAYVRDSDGNPIQPLSFGGLYLPLLENPVNCDKTPLLLAYYNSHFSALVPMHTEGGEDDCQGHKRLPLAIPLLDTTNGNPLPVHFSCDPGEEWMKTLSLSNLPKSKLVDEAALIKMYLHCEEFQYCPDHKRTTPSSSSHTSPLSGGSDLPHEASSSDSICDTQKHSRTRAFGKQIKEKFSGHKGTSKTKNSSPRGGKTKSVFWEHLKPSNNLILGAHLNINLPPNYKEMIANYLRDAKSSFSELQSKTRRTSVELIDKVKAKTGSSPGGATLLGPLSVVTEPPSQSDEREPHYTASKFSSSPRTLDDSSPSNIFMLSSSPRPQQSRLSPIPAANGGGPVCAAFYCSAVPKMQNYCILCYNKLPACSVVSCKLKATRDGYCNACYDQFVRTF